jgi:hypothetical protein
LSMIKRASVPGGQSSGAAKIEKPVDKKPYYTGIII